MVYAIGMHDHCVMTVHLRPPTNVDLRVQHGVCYAVIMAWHGPLLHPHGKGMVNGRAMHALPCKPMAVPWYRHARVK